MSRLVLSEEDTLVTCRAFVKSLAPHFHPLKNRLPGGTQTDRGELKSLQVELIVFEGLADHFKREFGDKPFPYEPHLAFYQSWRSWVSCKGTSEECGDIQAAMEEAYDVMLEASRDMDHKQRSGTIS